MGRAVRQVSIDRAVTWPGQSGRYQQTGQLHVLGQGSKAGINRQGSYLGRAVRQGWSPDQGSAVLFRTRTCREGERVAGGGGEMEETTGF